MADIDVETSAGSPKSATVDGVNVTQHSLSEQIAADKYLRSRQVCLTPWNALRRVKLIPPGAV